MMVLRRAEKKDIYQILVICRLSFRSSLRWLVADRWSCSWWDEIIDNTNICHLDVLEHDSRVYGFILTVIDPESFNRFKKENSLPLLNILFRVFLSPLIFFKAIYFNVFRKKSILLEKVHSADSTNACWIELIAVHPEARGSRFGSKMIQHHIEKFSSLYGFTKLYVDSNNLSAINLYRNFGFV